ncbi:MAG: phosphatidate cytidylyltransferase [Ruminococcus flavefaciens]|jgi:phosphatidate cytidylyltransferase|nr:phosphatidate cytidylyltransferase [Ruminococcus flavefaciens]
MLTRIISGAVGIVIMAGILFFHDTFVLPMAVAAIICVMLFELLRAVKLEKCIPILLAVEACGISMPFIYNRFYHLPEGIIGGADIPKTDGKMSVIAFAVTLGAAFIVFATWLRKHKEIRYEQVFFALASMVLVPQAMSTMVRIDRMDEKNGLFLLIMGLCGAWIADTGAYFTGVAFGKHKLCPEISPKKTIEGFVGGITFTGIAYAVAFSIRGGLSAFTMTAAFCLGVVCAVIGTIGDLSASMVKRQIGFKDYGRIMPGHGGLMDRFDSVLFVLPTFYIMTALLEEADRGLLG